MSKPVLRVQDLALTFTSQSGSLLQRQERQRLGGSALDFPNFFKLF